MCRVGDIIAVKKIEDKKQFKSNIYLDDRGNVDNSCRKIVEAFSFKNKNVRNS